MATGRRVPGAAPRSTAGFQADFALGKILDAVRPGATTELRIPVRRPDVLLVFDILVDNLRLQTGEHPRLVRSNPQASSYLIVEFPPQSFGEQAFLEVSSQAEPSAAETTAFPQEALQRHFARTSPARCHLATYAISQDGPTRLTAGEDTDTPGLQASEHTMHEAVSDVTTGSVRFSAAISDWPPNESLGHTDDETLVLERRRRLRSRRRARNYLRSETALRTHGPAGR